MVSLGSVNNYDRRSQHFMWPLVTIGHILDFSCVVYVSYGVLWRSMGVSMVYFVMSSIQYKTFKVQINRLHMYKTFRLHSIVFSNVPHLASLYLYMLDPYYNAILEGVCSPYYDNFTDM